MLIEASSYVMPRTTVDIDLQVLKEIKRIQREEGLSMGKLISRLLADALSRRKRKPATAKLRWISRRMKPLVDVADKEAVYAVFDRDRK
jgi:hypothetical protein